MMHVLVRNLEQDLQNTTGDIQKQLFQSEYSDVTEITAQKITRSVRFTETNQELGSLGLSWVRVGFEKLNPSSENQVRATLLLFDLLNIFIKFLAN